MEEIECRNCGLKSPVSAKYCSNCGRSLRFSKDPPKIERFTPLEVTSTKGVPELIKALDYWEKLEHPVVVNVSLENLRLALDKLRFPLAQIIIRRFGFDGNPPRSYAEIGREIDTIGSHISYQTSKALRIIRFSGILELLLDKEVIEAMKR
jgi:hypothetical protein